MPGRGIAGAPGSGGFVRRATISGLGGTMGRATGCPARFGFAGGRNGPPPPGLAWGAPGEAGTAGRRGCCRGAGALGIGAGRGAPGVAACELTPGIDIEGGVFGMSATPGGSGWRGPERICPGLGADGTGLAGIGAPREMGGAIRMDGACNGGVIGAPGCPVASGGRSG
jgi:hypothetical protein